MMRLYLLPISTRRTLLYCQRLKAPASGKQTWSDWIQAKAVRTWSGWERMEKGWQKSVVNYGNQVLRRIPYEEWGLKSVPPLSQRREQVEREGTEKVEVVYPKRLLAMDQVPVIVQRLATEREALHRRRLFWCFVGMPLTAPIGILPLIPNLPFFYLAYRAWSHWRALSGGKHLQFLIKNNLLVLAPSPVVDEVYAQQKKPLLSTPEPTTSSDEKLAVNPDPGSSTGTQDRNGETMLLTQANGKKMTQALDLPQLEAELERAIWQVERAIKQRRAEVAAKSSEQGKTSANEKESQ
ncbi:hypothetical protein VTH06DRAFT_4123 [Thermothelomyces fergusii]